MATLNRNLKKAQKFLTRGQLEEANALYQNVLSVNPNNSDALHSLGLIAYQEARFDDAIELINNSVKNALKSGKIDTLTEAYYFLGLTYHEKGQLEQAIEFFTKTIQNNNRYANAYAMMARTYAVMGEVKKAISLYEKSCALHPNSPVIWSNLANNYYFVREYAKAQKAYERALHLDPTLTVARKTLGNLYALDGQYAKAMEAFQRAFSEAPSGGLCIEMATILPYLYESEGELTQYRQQYMENLVALLKSDLKMQDPLKELQAPVNFFLAYQGENDRDINEGLGQLFSNAINLRPYIDHKPHEKIRVGFISRLFTNTHTIGQLTGGFIKELPRDQFDVSVFHIDPHYVSGVSTPEVHLDDVKHIKLPSRELLISAEIIASKELDVLFYSDIGMDLTTYFLSLNRLAAVQCCTWGHPVTTGVPNIDYFISSKVIEPVDADEHYTEKLVQFDKLPCYYDPPETEKFQLPKSEFGFEETENIYICPQSLQKLHPSFDPFFGDILRNDPNGKIILIRDKSELFNQKLLKRFSNAISDVLDRIVLIDRMEQERFLGLLSCADVMLDPIGFGGGNTNYQAFAFGTPIVTLPGEFMRGRVTLGCYEQMGIMDCVATSPDEYVHMATRLATDRVYHQEISEKIRTQNHLLYQDTEAVNELATFFSTAVEEARASSLATDSV